MNKLEQNTLENVFGNIIQALDSLYEIEMLNDINHKEMGRKLRKQEIDKEWNDAIVELETAQDSFLKLSINWEEI